MILVRLFEDSTQKVMSEKSYHNFIMNIITFTFQSQCLEAESKWHYNSFSVNVSTVDGFQDSKEDVILISSMRINANESVGFECRGTVLPMESNVLNKAKIFVVLIRASQ